MAATGSLLSLSASCTGIELRGDHSVQAKVAEPCIVYATDNPSGQD